MPAIVLVVPSAIRTLVPGAKLCEQPPPDPEFEGSGSLVVGSDALAGSVALLAALVASSAAVVIVSSVAVVIVSSTAAGPSRSAMERRTGPRSLLPKLDMSSPPTEPSRPPTAPPKAPPATALPKSAAFHLLIGVVMA